jgi:hypothetical protein
MVISAPCYLDYAFSLDRDLSLSLRHADSEECILITGDRDEPSSYLLNKWKENIFLITTDKKLETSLKLSPNPNPQVAIFTVTSDESLLYLCVNDIT